MKKHIFSLASCAAMCAVLCLSANADIIVSTGQVAAAGTPPLASMIDLGQAAGSTNTSAGLFNGDSGTTTSGTNGNPATTLGSGNAVTLNLDTSINTLGYDITQIDSIFGWATGSNGRSNQGYSIDLGLVGGGTATLVNGTHWEPNSPASYWTTVSFNNGSGGALESDSVTLNGTATAGAVTGTVATGVQSITWTITEPANAGGVIVAREFDVFGTPTVAAVPEPTSAVLLGLSAIGMTLVRRRR